MYAETSEDVRFAWASDTYNLVYRGDYVLSIDGGGNDVFRIQTEGGQSLFVAATDLEIESTIRTAQKEKRSC